MKASEDLSWAEEIPAPRDADGKLVPLRVATLYTDEGKCVTVGSLRYDSAIGCWTACYTDGFEICGLNRLHLTRPDSWERLEEDLTRAAKDEWFASIACAYADDEGNTCEGCKLWGSRGRCTRGMLEDIASRVRKLREEDNG